MLEVLVLYSLKLRYSPLDEHTLWHAVWQSFVTILFCCCSRHGLQHLRGSPTAEVLDGKRKDSEGSLRKVLCPRHWAVSTLLWRPPTAGDGTKDETNFQQWVLLYKLFLFSNFVDIIIIIRWKPFRRTHIGYSMVQLFLPRFLAYCHLSCARSRDRSTQATFFSRDFLRTPHRKRRWVQECINLFASIITGVFPVVVYWQTWLRCKHKHCGRHVADD